MITQMKEILRIGLTALFVLLSMMLYSKAALAYSEVRLNEDHAVTSPYIYLRDVFVGENPYQEHILAPAPLPDRQLHLTKRDLDRIVKAFNLQWVKDGDVRNSLTLTRDARLIDLDKMQNLIQQSSELQNKIQDDFEVELDVSPETAFLVPTTHIFELEVSKANYNVVTERFSVRVNAVKNGVVLKHFDITGTAQKILNVPVLTKRMRNGEIIESQDLRVVRLPAIDVEGNIVVDRSELIGMTPRKSLRDNTLITHADIVKPLMVQKNEFVIVEINRGPIKVSTRARALSNGSKGDLIQVMNDNSKKVIEGYVTGPQRISLYNGERS